MIDDVVSLKQKCMKYSKCRLTLFHRLAILVPKVTYSLPYEEFDQSRPNILNAQSGVCGNCCFHDNQVETYRLTSGLVIASYFVKICDFV